MRASEAVAAVLVLAAASGCNSAVSNADKLADVRGKGFGATGPMYPKHPWKVSYSWDCAQQLSEGRNVLKAARITVIHADDGSYVDHDYLTQRTGEKGDGVLSYDRPGAYLVTITTDCDFHLRVNQVRKDS